MEEEILENAKRDVDKLLEGVEEAIYGICEETLTRMYIDMASDAFFVIHAELMRYACAKLMKVSQDYLLNAIKDY